VGDFKFQNNFKLTSAINDSVRKYAMSGDERLQMF